MAMTLGEVVVKITGEIDGLKSRVDEAQSISESGGKKAGYGFATGFMSKLDKLSTAMPAMLSGLVAASIVGLGAAFLKLAADAAPLQGIAAAFEGISGSAEGTMAALRAGSMGMVTDVELMRNYNQAAQLVSTTFANQLPDAMGYLSKVAAATGQNMDYMMSSLV